LARRWYRPKARILGIERLADYDRIATIASEEARYTFAQAKETAFEPHEAFSPRLAEVAEELFANRRIDAPPQPGKRGGAFEAASRISALWSGSLPTASVPTS